jgi:hypothetical protein
VPIRLRLLDTLVEIESRDPAARALLTRLWEPFLTDEDDRADATFAVGHAGDVLSLSEGGTTVHHADLWTLTDALRYRMLEVVESRLARYVSLHAAAVARDGRLVLFAGPSGAGKTTLTLALLGAGWSYLTDDLAPVDRATGEVEPFPKPLGVKDPGRWDALAHAFAGLEGIARPQAGFLVPGTAFPIADSPLRPSRLFFAEFRSGARLEVRELTAANATALATKYVRRLDPEVVRVLNGLCSACRCAGLTYGDAADVATAADGLAGPP